MERDLWRRMMRAIRRVPRTRPRNAVYFDHEILAPLLWAALHGRPVSWACRRSSWPMQAWRRRLPDQSTMSRRARRPEIRMHLRGLLCVVQQNAGPCSTTLIVDGKALELRDQTRDPDARTGRGVRGYAKGYKLHALIDDRWRVLAWRVCPLNQAECVVAQGLVRDARRWSRAILPSHAWLLGDASYDSNRLHLRAATHGLALIAPRRRPDRALAVNRMHHHSRRRSVSITEGEGSPSNHLWLDRRRSEIERFFGSLATAGTGLDRLPAWARRLHRCELWVGAKLIVHAARLAHQRANAA